MGIKCIKYFLAHLKFRNYYPNLIYDLVQRYSVIKVNYFFKAFIILF